MKSARGGKAFTILELLAICAVLVILVAIALPWLAQGRERTSRIKCVNNLKAVGLSFRIFAENHDGKFPRQMVEEDGGTLTNMQVTGYFKWLAGELSTPRILYCPEDAARAPGQSFTNFTRTNVSYFVSLSARETMPGAFLAGDRNLIVNSNVVKPGLLVLTTNDQAAWTREIHEFQGNIAMGDGSVRTFSNNGLNQAVKSSGVRTNLLLVP